MQRKNRKTLSDILFVVPIVVGSLAYGIGQTHQMLESVEGLTFNFFLFSAVFMLLNFILAIRVMIAEFNRNTIESAAMYGIGVATFLTQLGLFLHKGGEWQTIDTIVAAVVLVVLVITWLLTKFGNTGLTYKDPIVEGVYSLTFKAIPSLFLAFNVAEIGTAGLDGWAVFGSLLVIAARFGQVYFARITEKPEEGQKAILIAEGGNWAAWFLVAATWSFKSVSI